MTILEKIEEIEKIAEKAMDDDYDSDNAVLDLMAIYMIASDISTKSVPLTPFDTMVLDSLTNLRRQGFIDNH